MYFDKISACHSTASGGVRLFLICLSVPWAFLHSSACLWEVLWNQSKGQSLNAAYSQDPALDLQLVATQHNIHKESPEQPPLPPGTSCRLQGCSPKREFCNSRIGPVFKISSNLCIKSKKLHFVSTNSFITFSTGLCCLKVNNNNDGNIISFCFVVADYEKNNYYL